jgi:alkylated DNA repair dioxygenase AlkB
MALLMQPGITLHEGAINAIVVDLSDAGLTGKHTPYVHQDELQDWRVGPVTVYPGKQPLEARLMLNAWRRVQLFREHAERSAQSEHLVPTIAHARWLLAGLQLDNVPTHLPELKDCIPLYSVWRNCRLGSAEAYLRVYIPLYVEGLIRGANSRTALLDLQKLSSSGGRGEREPSQKKLLVYDGCGVSDLDSAAESSFWRPAPGPVISAILQGVLVENVRKTANRRGLTMSPRDLPVDLSGLRDGELIEGLVGGAQVHYRAEFLNCMADRYFELLRPGGAAAIPWQRRTLRMFGKAVREGHDTAFFGDPGTSYHYTGTNHPTVPWDDDPSGALAELRDIARLVTGHEYNLALLNFYTPIDSIGAHSDDESDLVPGSPIFSVSLGRARLFWMQAKGGSGAKGRPIMKRLAHGSVLVMAGLTQKAYKHYVDAEKMRPGETGPEDRVNITFRCVVKKA